MSRSEDQRPELMNNASVQDVLEFTRDPSHAEAKYRAELNRYRIRKTAKAAWSWVLILVFAVGAFTVAGWFK